MAGVFPRVRATGAETRKRHLLFSDASGHMPSWFWSSLSFPPGSSIIRQTRLPNFPTRGQPYTRLHVSGLIEFLLQEKLNGPTAYFLSPRAEGWRPARDFDRHGVRSMVRSRIAVIFNRPSCARSRGT